MTLADLAAAVGCPFEGDGSLSLVRVATIEQAGPGDLTFLANPKYARALGGTRASAVIAAPDLAAAPCAILRSPEPYVTFAHAAALLMPADRPPAGVHSTAVVDPTATIAATASIGPFAVVEAKARIGDRTVIHPHVVVGAGTIVGADCVLHAHVSIRERCRLGDRVVVQNGAVIGSDGFGFATRKDGSHLKIPQAGPVIVEDDVEIGAHTAVDRPAVGETRIEAGTKIDNLVQIGHGVVLGRHVLLAAQVGIAGSTKVGSRAVLGGQVGVGGHLTLGEGMKAVGQSGITNSVDAGAFVSGYPAIENIEWRKASAVFRKLPEMRKRLRELEQRLETFEQQQR